MSSPGLGPGAAGNLTLAAVLAARGLPPAPDQVVAKGRYMPAVIDGRRAYLSGHGPLAAPGAGFTHVGQLGVTLDVAAGREAARACAVALLASLDSAVGLYRVERLLRMTGYLWASGTFTRHAEVLDAASETMQAVLGERGGHARSAVGAASLPFGVPVVLELTAVISSRYEDSDGDCVR